MLCFKCISLLWTLSSLAEGFMPIKSPSEFTHRSVASPATYDEFVHVEDRVPNGLAAPVRATSSNNEDIMTIQQQRIQALRQRGSSEDSNESLLKFQSLKKPAITFEEIRLHERNHSSTGARDRQNMTSEGEFRPSDPVFPQGLYYQSNRRDFGVSVNPILSPYGEHEIQSLEPNAYILPDESETAAFGVTVEPMTIDQAYDSQAYHVQYIIENEDSTNNEVKDQVTESSHDIYNPPSKLSHPALVKWTTSTTTAPPRAQVTTPKVEYAQQIDALHYFPPTFLSKGQKKPIKEKVHGSPLPNLSLLFLGKHGPSFPVFNHMMSDLHGAMERLMGNPLGMFNGNLGSFFSLMRSYLGNASMGSYGDNKLDVFDFIPLLAVLVAGALIFVGTFPNGLNVLTLNQSTLPLGGRRSDEDSMFDMAFNQLESGVMMISAIRHEDSCSAKLACKLGNAAKDSFPNKDMLLGAVNLFLGEKYLKFSRSFEDAMEGRDRSSCQEECTRCMAI